MKNFKYNNKINGFISIFAIFFCAIVISVLTALYILLVKQLEIMDIDSTSFQALFVADSAFECMVYKLQNATGTSNYFLPQNYNGIGNCGTVNDLKWTITPVVSNNRATSQINIDFTTSAGDYCTVILTGIQTNNSEVSNSMSISSQSRTCSSSTSTKITERDIDFYF